MKYLAPSQINRIAGFRTLYEAAADSVRSMPWQALVPMHYRESTLGAEGDHTTGEGMMGCDPGDGKPETIAEMARKVAGVYGWACPATDYPLDDDLGLSLLVAAHTLKIKALGALTTESGAPDESALKVAWFRYNGASVFYSPRLQGAMRSTAPEEEMQRLIALPDARAIRSPDWSPYVSNDPLAGFVLHERATLPPLPGQTERRKINRPDARPGCLAIWRDVMEAFPA